MIRNYEDEDRMPPVHLGSVPPPPDELLDGGEVEWHEVSGTTDPRWFK